MNIKTLLKKTILSRHKIKPFNIDDAKVVILGTFPGEESLKCNKYYSNPTNKFWELLGIKFGDFEALKDKGIGLWDVIKYCDRDDNGKNTSADKHIKNEVYNDLFKLNGKNILFNGKKAYNYYIKAKKNPKYANWPEVDEDKILKSSSAALSIKFEEKQKDWNKKLKKMGIK